MEASKVDQRIETFIQDIKEDRLELAEILALRSEEIATKSDLIRGASSSVEIMQAIQDQTGLGKLFPTSKISHILFRLNELADQTGLKIDVLARRIREKITN